MIYIILIHLAFDFDSFKILKKPKPIRIDKY